MITRGLTIPITVLLAVFLSLAIWTLLRPTIASESPAGALGVAAEQAQQGSRLEARASSNASASSRSGAQCRAQSSSRASARAGGDHDYQEDHDSTEHSGGDCRAEASSRAKATSGPLSDE
jgi:hypothetical protein